MARRSQDTPKGHLCGAPRRGGWGSCGCWHCVSLLRVGCWQAHVPNFDLPTPCPLHLCSFTTLQSAPHQLASATVRLWRCGWTGHSHCSCRGCLPALWWCHPSRAERSPCHSIVSHYHGPATSALLATASFLIITCLARCQRQIVNDLGLEVGGGGARSAPEGGGQHGGRHSEEDQRRKLEQNLRKWGYSEQQVQDLLKKIKLVRPNDRWVRHGRHA